MAIKQIESPPSEKIDERDIYGKIKALDRIRIVNGRMCVQEDTGFWHTATKREAKVLLRGFFRESLWQQLLSDSLVSSLINTLESDPDLQTGEDFFADSNFLALENGVLDIVKGEIISEGVENLRFKRRVPVKFQQCEEGIPDSLESFGKNVFQEQYLKVKLNAILEIIGYCISDSNALKIAVFLIGPANCGKSVILRFIQRLVGEGNYSNVSLTNFGGRFDVVQMDGKVVNINGEVSCGGMSGKAFDVFKSITGGDSIELERKGMQSYSTKLNTKLLFAGNLLPDFGARDGSDSFVERLHILKFDRTVEETDRDPKIEARLWEDRNMIVTQALMAFKGVLKNGKFTVAPDEKELLKSVSDMANPVAHFVEEQMECGEGYEIYVSDAYDSYLSFATEESLPKLSRTQFRNQMIMQSGVSISNGKKRLNGKPPKRYFIGIREKEYDK